MIRTPFSPRKGGQGEGLVGLGVLLTIELGDVIQKRIEVGVHGV
jgi:hypothetical protein